MITFKEHFVKEEKEMLPLYAILAALALALAFIRWLVAGLCVNNAPLCAAGNLVFIALGVFCVALLIWAVAVQPIVSYVRYVARVSHASEEVHWTGGLNKAMHDLAKAENNGKDIDGPAKILQKEVQVHLGIRGVKAGKIAQVQAKVVGIFLGMGIETKVSIGFDPEEEAQGKEVVLDIGGKKFRRKEDQIS
jgi:hypothetical protein